MQSRACRDNIGAHPERGFRLMDDAARMMFQRITVAIAVLLEEKGVATRLEFAQVLAGSASYRGDASLPETAMLEADNLTMGLAEGLKPQDLQH